MKLFFTVCLFVFTSSFSWAQDCHKQNVERNPEEQDLGSCQFADQFVFIHQQKSAEHAGHFLFRVYDQNCLPSTEQGLHEITFLGPDVWPYSKIHQAYWKYRNGSAGNGMFSWNRLSGEGFLKFYQKLRGSQPNEVWFYVKLNQCQVDESLLRFEER